MILKRQEKDNKIKAMYSSSNVCASIFDKDSKDLILIFNNGGQYKYPKVAETDYTRFELAESQGSVFNTHIKKYTNFEKLDKIDVTEILKEVNALKDAEDKTSSEAKTKSMLESMTTLISTYIVSGKVNPDTLRKVEERITAYNKITNQQPIPQA